MNNTTELIAHFNQSKALIIMPAMVLILIALLFFVYHFKDFFKKGILTFFVKGILYLGIALYSMTTLFSYSLLNYDGPALIINERGIWAKYYNFIPWENIKEVARYNAMGKLEVISIRIKDVSVASKNADFSGKNGLFWAQLLGNYHINLANLDKSNEEIMAIINRYVEQVRK